LSKAQTPYRFIISGGGTGGHIYPALAIANALKEQFPDAAFLFVGAQDRMEMQKVPEAGYAIEGLNITGIQRKLSLKNLLWPFKLIGSLLKARRIVKQFKPHVAIGTGGFASGPLLYMAARSKVPCLIAEQNSFAGLTNKLLAKKVQTICVAHHGMDRFFPTGKIVFTGNPVRQDIIQAAQPSPEQVQQHREHFGLDPHKPTLLVIGGSLGARTLNQCLQAGLPTLEKAGVQVLWQTGRFYYKNITEALEQAPPQSSKVYEFIRTMDKAYGAANVVVSRAGALSISELAVAAKPAILVPSPNVAEDHQTKNAQSLVQEGAALMVADHDAPQKLIDTALNLLQNPTQQQTLSTAVQALGRPNAARHIAQQVVALIA